MSISQIIRFDDGIKEKGGLSLSIARNASTYNGQDASVGPNLPRYGKRRAVSQRSEPTARNDAAGNALSSYLLLAGGLDNDGVSPLALIMETGAANGIWVRSGNELNTQAEVVPAPSPIDLMGNADATRSHFPKGAKIVHGLIFALCAVKRIDGPNTEETVTLIYSQNSGADWALWPVEAGSQWPTDARYPIPTASSTSTSRGNVFAVNWFPADDLEEPLDVWITFTDYMNTPKDGGSVYIARATRTSVGGAWTVQEIRRIHESVNTATTEHAHSCGMMKDPATGYWYAAVFFGDTNYNHTTKIQIGTSTAGNGGTDYLTASLTTTATWSGGAAGATNVPRSPQPGACFPLANGDIGAAADNEQNAVVAIKASSLSDAKAEWYNVGPQAGSIYDGTFSLSGDFTRDRLGRCYTTRHHPREGSGVTKEKNAIASIDGIKWFDLAGDGIWNIAGPYLARQTGVTFETIPRPQDVQYINPLEIAPGGQNIAPVSLMTLTPTNPKNGTVVNRVDPDVGGDYLWPAGFTKAGQPMPAPPRPGVVTAFNAAAATNFECWAQQIGPNPPPSGNGTDWMVVLWVLVPQDMANIAFKIWQNGSQSNQSRMLGNEWRKISMQRQWVTTNSAAFRMLCDLVSVPAQRPEFAVLLEGAYEGRVTPYQIPFATSGRPNENARVQGVLIDGSDWSVSADMMYPDYYDAAHGLGPLMTVYQDASNHVLVETVDSPSGGAPNGYPYDFKITSTVAGTPSSAYIDGASLDLPGAAMRVTVSKLGADTLLHIQHAGVWPVETATVAGSAVPTPTEVVLAGDHDASNVNALEFHSVAVSDTASNAEGILNSVKPNGKAHRSAARRLVPMIEAPA